MCLSLFESSFRMQIGTHFVGRQKNNNNSKLKYKIINTKFLSNKFLILVTSSVLLIFEFSWLLNFYCSFKYV